MYVLCVCVCVCVCCVCVCVCVAAASSRLYSSFTPALMNGLQTDKLTYNYHKKAITVDTYKANPSLSNVYKILSTSVDRNGVEFISSIEGNFHMYR